MEGSSLELPVRGVSPASAALENGLWRLSHRSRAQGQQVLPLAESVRQTTYLLPVDERIHDARVVVSKNRRRPLHLRVAKLVQPSVLERVHGLILTCQQDPAGIDPVWLTALRRIGNAF